MTIDHYIALATALMTVANTIWLSALVLEIHHHNNAVRDYNATRQLPTNTTPPKVPPIVVRSTTVQQRST